MQKCCISNNFSMNLRALRIMEGLTQAELAEKVGYGQNHVSYWEKGKTFPGIEALLKLAIHFDISLDALLYHPECKKWCNPVCLQYKRMTRAERRMDQDEMLEWRSVMGKVTEFMEIKSQHCRKRYLGILKSLTGDIYRLAITEIVNAEFPNKDYSV